MTNTNTTTSTMSLLVEQYHDLIVSVFYIIAISGTAQFLRIIVRTIFTHPKSWLRILSNEVIATGEMCATCFELGNVADNYGIEYYAIFYFLSSLWWALTWLDAYACPNNHIEDYLENETDVGSMVLISFTELLTACYIYRLVVKPIWAMSTLPIHQERLQSTSCTADLTVPPLYGAGVEGLGILVFGIVSKIFAQKIKSEFTCAILSSLLDTILVVLAYDISGGYFNPVLATSMQFGCEGATSLEHIEVYWIGGILGTLANLYGSRRLKYLWENNNKEE